MPKLKFPEGFIWSAGNSAIQCEGNNLFSDWEYYQKDNFVKSGEKIGLAVDHYNHYKEDFDLTKKLNLNGHRLTVEWSRIEPQDGQFNEEEIKHYREVLTYLKNNNIKTVVTLHHFSIPTWLALKDGWSNKDSVDYFTRFTQKVVEEIGELIDYWVIINEPNTYIGLGYLIGEFPPLKRNPIKAFKVMKNLIQANNKAYDIIHQSFPSARVGSANNCQLATAKMGRTKGPILNIVNYLSNFYFIEKTINYQDYLGLNYYFPARLSGKVIKERSDMNWEIYPKGFYDSITTLWNRYQKPIFILENGIADSADTKREYFIRQHLLALYKAIQSGAEVIGYTYWSLTDNFELAKGFGPKFGLISVDLKTYKRSIKNSTYSYAEIAKNNYLEAETSEISEISL